MNQNEHRQTMYETVPAVAGLNRVEGFDPLKLLRRTTSRTTGEEVMGLALDSKKLWFRLAHPGGRIGLNAIRVTEEMAVLEARVYLNHSDENPVSSFISCFTRAEAPGAEYIRMAQSEAVDRALTDAGFGLQFSDVCGTDKDRYGGRVPMADVRDGLEKGGPSASAGTVSPAGDVSRIGNEVRPISGAANHGIEAAPGQEAQSAGNAGTAQPAAGQMQSSEGNVRVAQPAVTQGQKMPSAMSGKPAPAVTTQGKTVPPAGNARQGQTVAAQSHGMTPAGNTRVVQAAAAQGHGTVPAGNARPMQPVAVHRQAAQTSGAAQSATAQGQERQSGAGGGSVRPIREQCQEEQPAGNVGTPRPATGQAQSSGGKVGMPRLVAGQVQSSRENMQADRPAVAQGQKLQSPGTVRHIVAQSQQTNQRTAVVLPVRPDAAQEFPDQLPVPPVSIGGRETGNPAAQGVTVHKDSLPVPPAGQAEPVAMTAAGAAADTLPVPAKGSGEGTLQKSVQGAMALLGGQKPSTSTDGNGAEKEMANTEGNGAENVAGNIAEYTAAAPTETVPADQAPSVAVEAARKESAPCYTPDMSVEEIVSRMTLEEAGRVVVDTGVCKGQTIAEVAQRRPPSLKFYRYGGYKGNNNILRAAAQIMLDSFEAQKAS